MAKSSSGAFGFVLKALAILLMILAPLLAVWIASSLAAYLNARTVVPLVAGLALFPGLPLAWDPWAEYRRARNPRMRVRKRFLTFGDRLILRTLALNLVFLAVLLALNPERAFVALASRGDWMLGRRVISSVSRSCDLRSSRGACASCRRIGRKSTRARRSTSRSRTAGTSSRATPPTASTPTWPASRRPAGGERRRAGA
jgi:hypothetical protein